MEATGIHSYNCSPIMFAMILMTVWQSAHTCRLFMMSYGVLSVLINLCIQWPVSCYRGTNRKTFLLPHRHKFCIWHTPSIMHLSYNLFSLVWNSMILQWSWSYRKHCTYLAIHLNPDVTWSSLSQHSFTPLAIHYHSTFSLRTQLQAQQQHRCLISAHCL